MLKKFFTLLNTLPRWMGSIVLFILIGIISHFSLLGLFLFILQVIDPIPNGLYRDLPLLLNCLRIIFPIILSVGAVLYWCTFDCGEEIEPSQESHRQQEPLRQQDTSPIAPTPNGYEVKNGYCYTPDGDIIITTDEALADFHYNHYLIQERHVKVADVSFRNDDGTNRQTILAHCHAGDDIIIRHFTYNGDPAYAVYTEYGQIGNLPSVLAEEMESLPENTITSGKILSITGGYSGKDLGCNITLSFYGTVNHYSPHLLSPIVSAPASCESGVRTLDTMSVPETTYKDEPLHQIVSVFEEDKNVEERESPPQQPQDPFENIRDSRIMAHYIVLDIETTGFSKDVDKIIEIAAIHYVFGIESDRFHTFVNPQIPIPKHITKLTGIHQSDVDPAPILDEISDDFRSFIKDYPLVGHNIINFDLPFITSHMDINTSRVVIDTLDMARIAFPMLPSHKLSNLNYWFDLDNNRSHRAAADAAATNALLWACLYPDNYATLYRKAMREGIPEESRVHKAKANHYHNDIRIKEIKPSSNTNVKPGPLAGKRIVFTGELSISRKDAMQIAVDAGALLRSSVSGKTDYLVVGAQDPSIVGADGMSTKEKTAHQINSDGKGCIKIINEKEFIDLINTDC